MSTAEPDDPGESQFPEVRPLDARLTLQELILGGTDASPFMERLQPAFREFLTPFLGSNRVAATASAWQLIKEIADDSATPSAAAAALYRQYIRNLEGLLAAATAREAEVSRSGKSMISASGSLGLPAPKFTIEAHAGAVVTTPSSPAVPAGRSLQDLLTDPNIVRVVIVLGVVLWLVHVFAPGVAAEIDNPVIDVTGIGLLLKTFQPPRPPGPPEPPGSSGPTPA